MTLPKAEFLLRGVEKKEWYLVFLKIGGMGL